MNYFKPIYLSILSCFVFNGAIAGNYYCNSTSGCTTDWIKVNASDANTDNIICQAPNAYLDNWTWSRDHWTVTCWWTFPSLPVNQHNITCRNWNTVWGDAHNYKLTIYCKPTDQAPSGGGELAVEKKMDKTFAKVKE